MIMIITHLARSYDPRTSSPVHRRRETEIVVVCAQVEGGRIETKTNRKRRVEQDFGVKGRRRLLYMDRNPQPPDNTHTRGTAIIVGKENDVTTALRRTYHGRTGPAG